MTPTLNYALAVALLTSPTDFALTEKQESAFATYRRTVQAVALEWEVMDQRETSYFFMNADGFYSDLRTIRRRHFDLFDAPPLHDHKRFPERIFVNELLSANRLYRSYLNARIELYPSTFWDIKEAVTETDHLYYFWDLIRDCKTDYYMITIRRNALAKIREEIGYQSYYSGKLPPHLPIWRFGRID